MITRAGRNDVAPSDWESFSIPADDLDLDEITGLRKDADGVISLELALSREYLPVFTAKGNLDIAAAPLALPPPPSTDVIFDMSGYLPAASNYVPVEPTRLLDTRQSGQQHVGALVNAQVIEVTLAGNAGLPQPNEIGAVVLNVTVVPQKAGYLTVYPDAMLPDTSNINFAENENTAGLVIIAPGFDGKINLRNVTTPGFSSHVVVDVFGYFPPVADIHMVTPKRVFDSRVAPYGPKFAANETRDVQLAGVGGIPFQGVGAVIANVTAANPAATGWTTVYEDGTLRPGTTNLHYVTNAARTNLVILPLSNQGYASIYTSQSAHYVVDVLGWFGEGVDFEPISPLRLVDTRNDPNGELGPIDPLSIEAVGPDDMVAIFGNLTAVKPTMRGYLQVYLDVVLDPTNLNFYAGKTVSNAVMTPVSPEGQFDVRATFVP
ncbi:hypothetical protein ACNOYE_27485 [Nannocystaceae bacterium ST9]